LLTKTHVFYQDMEKAMREEATKHAFELRVQSCEMNLGQQADQIETFVAQGVDALIVCPADSKSIGTSIQRANQEKIPVFTADISADSGQVVCHVASDNVEGGRLAGRFLAEQLKNKGNVIVIDHPTVKSVQDRTQGFMEEIARHPDIKIVARPPGNGMKDPSMRAMESMLQRHPDVRAVFAINDDTALGALAALEAAGRKDILIVGYDGTPEAQAKIRQGGQLVADVVQHPDKIGVTTIQMIADHFAGKTPPATVPVEVSLITRASLLKPAAPQ
jgi:ribose transport system substrate-binding protein